MSMIPRYLMDREGFYYNPECPDLGLIFAGQFTIDDIRKLRIPVRIFRDGVCIEPNGKIPVEIRENTLVLEESAN
jgi:hypothetical protein